MEIVGYQAKITITQVLPCVNEDITRNYELELKQLIDSSWLYDPFGDNLTYGVEFKVGRCFSWTFFLFAETIEMAEELGGALLYNLQEKYKGLDGLETLRSWFFQPRLVCHYDYRSIRCTWTSNRMRYSSPFSNWYLMFTRIFS